MRYMLLLYGNEEGGLEPGTPEQEAEMGAWWAFNEEAGKAGVLELGNPLHPTAAATCVQVRDGDVVATDGPFAETAEQLGGYYILDVADLDEATRWAAKIPTAYNGGQVEIRPIVDMSELPGAPDNAPTG